MNKNLLILMLFLVISHNARSDNEPKWDINSPFTCSQIHDDAKSSNSTIKIKSAQTKLNFYGFFKFRESPSFFIEHLDSTLILYTANKVINEGLDRDTYETMGFVLQDTTNGVEMDYFSFSLLRNYFSSFKVRLKTPEGNFALKCKRKDVIFLPPAK